MRKKNRVVGIIPARLKSTRLPEKMLLMIKNNPLVYYTYKQVLKSKLDKTVVAVDHKRLFDSLKQKDCEVIMTSVKHKSGTDRIGEAAKSYKADYYINIQGDEPLISPNVINQMIAFINKNSETEILTIGKLINNKKEIHDPNVVKLVMNNQGEALYFSRCTVPFNRNQNEKQKYIKHLGIYGYRKDILRKIIKLKPSALEKAEKLEQLRFLENGFKINILLTKYDTVGVDTKGDFIKVKKIIEGEK